MNTAVSPLCAWCLAEQGIPAGEGSHGICKKHQAEWVQTGQEQILARWQAKWEAVPSYVDRCAAERRGRSLRV